MAGPARSSAPDRQKLDDVAHYLLENETMDEHVFQGMFA